jgi:phosphoribosyl-AMP cyclohydrolase
MSWIHSIKWDSDGLVPVIAQDYKTNKVLMFAWMNQEALELTQKNKKAFYWSRSRKKIWEKGEESGHTQNVREIRLDCDGDVILIKIEQVENIACHTGRETSPASPPRGRFICAARFLVVRGCWHRRQTHSR